MQSIDVLWVLFSTALVLLMQAGFLFLEAGLTRAKNSINVAVKNIVDLGFSILLFWIVGYGLMFGSSVSSLFGSSSFGFDVGAAGPDVAAFFIFQAVFAGTTVTIISGAIAERTRFSAYLGIVLLMAFVYPVVGHWVWGGGWLAARGFVDFAGSTVVHATGGWAALVACAAIGPRLGRFAEDGTARPITPSNLPMAMFGGIVLAFGWIGFNGGSVLAFDDTVPGVVVITLFGGSAGMAVALVLSTVRKGYIAPTAPLNGLLGGLVAVTAGAHALPTGWAVITGGVGGAIAFWGEGWLERRGIDDAVGAVPVHLMAGSWGTLAVGLFGRPEVLGTDLSRIDQVGTQALGIGATSLFVVSSCWLGLKVIAFFSPLRVTAAHEAEGLNAAEHRSSTALFDLVEQLQRQARTGEIGEPLESEPFTEVGEIAGHYNDLTEQLRTTAAVAQSIAEGRLDVDVVPRSEQDSFGLAFRGMVGNLRRTVRSINGSAAELRHSVGSLETLGRKLDQGVEEQLAAVDSGTTSFDAVRAHVVDLTQEVSKLSAHTNGALEQLSYRLDASRSTADTARSGAEKTAETVRDGGERLLTAVRAIDLAAADIDRIVEVVRDVADSTRVLALNASIEAARAGDAGRSFSIVANEVNDLAMGTLESLRDIEAAVARVQDASTQAVEVSDGVVKEAVILSERTALEIRELEAVASSEAQRSVQTRDDFATLGESMVRRAADLDVEMTAANSALGTIGVVTDRTRDLVHQLRSVEQEVSDEAHGLDERLAYLRTGGD